MWNIYRDGIVLLTLAIVENVLALEAKFNGESVVITDKTRRITIPAVVEDHAIYKVIHSIQRRGPDYYLVVGACVWSRGWPPKGGYCGCGTESSIEWFHIQDGKIIARQEGRYESCRQNRYGYNISWKHGLLQWSTEGQRHEGDGASMKFIPVDYSWTFDPAHPEKGIKERSKDAPQ